MGCGGGCGCDDCATLGELGELVAPECDAPTGGLLLWPSDVEALIRRVDVHMRSTDDTVASCHGISHDEAVNWSRFYASWRASADREVGLFGLGKRWDETCAFSRELSGYRDKLRPICALTGPLELPKQQGPDLSALKWVAGAVIVVGVAWGVRSAVIAFK